MHHVAFDGSRVAYRKDGRGAPVVLVHGTGGDSETHWGLLVDRLAAEWTVIRPDYAGSGGTTDDGRPLTVAWLAGQVAAAAADAGAARFHLVGFSLGAGIAVQIAAERPGLVRSLVLIGGFASADDARLQLELRLWRDLIRTDRDALARLFLLSGFSPEALAALGESGIAEALALAGGLRWDGMARQIELDLTLDVRAEAARVSAPTLVVGGTHDQMVPPAHARALATLIRGSRYAELPTGHLAPVERPDALADLLVPFLRAHAA